MRSHRINIILIAVSIFVAFTLFFANIAYAQDTDNPSVNKTYRSIQIYSGDSLSKIVAENCPKEFDTFEHYSYEICSINHITEDDSLIAGNYLIIPCYIR